MTAITHVAHRTVALCVALLIGACAAGKGAAPAPSKAIPTASQISAEPSLAPSPFARPLRTTGEDGILDPGTYVLDLFPVHIVFDIPEGDPPGWFVGTSDANAAVVLWFTPPEITYEFAFSTADNVYIDPCDSSVGEVDPPIGPSVDDLVAALSDMPEFRMTAPVDVTVGAFAGKRIELTALDAGSDCPEVIAFRAGDEDYDLVAGQTGPMHILDVDGVRIVMRILEPVGRDAAGQAELKQILDSIRIQALP